MAMSSSHKADLSRVEVEAAFANCRPETPGFIRLADLKMVMRALGFDPRNAEVEEMMGKLKETQRKRKVPVVEDNLSIDEFIELMHDKLANDKTTEEMRCAFKLFDREGKGWITVDNLRQVSHELGENVGDDELEEMVKEATEGGDGRVDEQAFFRIMKRTCLY